MILLCAFQSLPKSLLTAWTWSRPQETARHIELGQRSPAGLSPEQILYLWATKGSKIIFCQRIPALFQSHFPKCIHRRLHRVSSRLGDVFFPELFYRQASSCPSRNEDFCSSSGKPRLEKTVSGWTPVHIFRRASSPAYQNLIKELTKTDGIEQTAVERMLQSSLPEENVS